MKTIVDSQKANVLNLTEIFRFKDLLWNLAMRDVLVRYKQTIMGVLWAIVRPLVNIIIFGLLSQFIEHSTNVADKLVTVSAGVIIWGLISTSISDISNSILNNSNILTKVYFPKLIIPLSSLAVCLIDFAISFVILLIVKIAFVGMPSVAFFLFPLFVLYALVFSFSIGLFFATLNVKFRDIKFIIPFLLQVGFYVCPVFLSTQFYLDKLPEVLKPVFLSNPLVSIIDGFKYCLIGAEFLVPQVYFISGIVITLLLLFFSLRYFVKFEKTFADYI